MQRVLAKITECETFNLLVDTLHLVFTELHQFDFLEQEGYSIGVREKILLCAGNSCISSPLAFNSLGKIYLHSQSGQSAGNFTQSTKATASAKNTYTHYKNLPKISEHVPLHKSNLSDTDFGYFLAGLIEGDG